MKRIMFIVLALMFLLITAATCYGGDTQLRDIKKRGVLRVGVKVDVPLFGNIDLATNEIEGMEIDLARALAKDILGDENAIEFFAVNAKTRGPMLQNGIVDVIMATFTITEERRQSYSFSEPYYTDELGILVRKDSSIMSFADIDGKIVGVAQSGTARTALAAQAQEHGVELIYKEFANYPEVKAALLSGDVDAFSVDRSILRGYIDDETRLLERGFNPQDYGIATRLEGVRWSRRVNTFVLNLKKSGELDAIISRWGI